MDRGRTSHFKNSQKMKLYLKEEEFYQLVAEKMQRYGMPIFFREYGIDKIEFKHLPLITLTYTHLYGVYGGMIYCIVIEHEIST